MADVLENRIIEFSTLIGFNIGLMKGNQYDIKLIISVNVIFRRPRSVPIPEFAQFPSFIACQNTYFSIAHVASDVSIYFMEQFG